MVRQQNQLFAALLCVADAAAIALACAVAWGIRRASIEEFWPESWETYAKEPLFLFVVPIMLWSMRTAGLFRPRRDRSLASELDRVARASLLTVGLTIVVLWAVGNDMIVGDPNYGTAIVLGLELDASRLQLGALAVSLPLVVGVHRAIFRLLLRALRVRGWNQRHVAILGVGRLGQIAHRTLTRNPWTGIRVGYFISHHDRQSRKTCLGKPVRGGLDDLESILENSQIDAIYLALPTSRATALPKVLRRLERFSLDVRIVPDVPPRYLTQSMAVNELDGMPILSYRECPLYGLGGAGKRIIDLLGAAVAVVLFSPLMLAIAIAVRMSGPGPSIFRQRRVSLGGEQFEIFKFRTMRHETDEQPATWTERDDPRITRIGAWLRRTSLDELPQLFNVLRGEMSLVGPRPERPELIERFRDDWRGYMLRQHVKAGITGWAQVKGHRGDTGLKKRLQHDLYYIRHWSLGFDFKILWMTLFRGFIHRNAH
ncbi:MAG: undecaprenyl-phosphate glucose phosphotransferase [Planctomycetota bacterium]